MHRLFRWGGHEWLLFILGLCLGALTVFFFVYEGSL
jgi:hypothetical protein